LFTVIETYFKTKSLVPASIKPKLFYYLVIQKRKKTAKNLIFDQKVKEKYKKLD